MKTTILCIVIIIIELIIAIAATSAEPVAPEVKLSRVELFQSGEQVFKQVVFKTTDAHTVLRIPDIPANIDPSTVRACALGSQKTWAKSRKDYPIVLRIENQVPITTSTSFGVAITESSEAKHEEKTGKLTWEFKLAAMDTESRAFSYEVKFPKGARVFLE